MKTKLFFVVIALIVMVAASGCGLLIAGAAGGAGTAFWLSGKLVDEVNASYERAIKATEDALASLKMDVLKKTYSEEVTQIRSEYSDGSKVWIDVRPLTTKTSKLEIRVGATGDEISSKAILERIKRYI